MLKIPPDWTLLYQIVLFFGLWALLRRVWFEPALRVLKERSKRSAGALAEAAQVQAEVERMRNEHAQALEQTRADAQKDVQEILRTAQAEQRRVIEEATSAAEQTLAMARGNVAKEIATARAELNAQVEGIARQVVAAVLGRAV